MIPWDCRVYELRQYTLRPGTRDAFVQLFETNLLDAQDEAGMPVLGQFRDVERPDVFVWMRAFADMERRRQALSTFYYGSVWAAHRDQANSMMIDSDDVLLLEPADARPVLSAQVGPRPPVGGTPDASVEIEVTICPVRAEDTTSYFARHREHIASLQRSCGGRPLPALQSLHAPNTFPQLPVHEDKHVAVTLTRHAGLAVAARRGAEPACRASTEELDALATGPVHRLRLRPTARSALR